MLLPRTNIHFQWMMDSRYFIITMVMLLNNHTFIPHLPIRRGNYGSISRQEYSMNCSLCGYGSATVSVLPDDPREKQLF